MNTKNYAVVFTGQINQKLNRETVVSNLVLELKISDEKARALLDSPGLLLKHFDNIPDAQRLIDLLDRAGAKGSLLHPQAEPVQATASNSESTLIRLLGALPRKAGNQSLLARFRLHR